MKQTKEWKVYLVSSLGDIVKVFIQDINSRRYLNLSRIDSNNNMGYLFMTIE